MLCVVHFQLDMCSVRICMLLNQMTPAGLSFHKNPLQGFLTHGVTHVAAPAPANSTLLLPTMVLAKCLIGGERVQSQGLLFIIN